MVCTKTVFVYQFVIYLTLVLAKKCLKMAGEVVVDALPYIDQGYDDPGVREAVRMEPNLYILIDYISMISTCFITRFSLFVFLWGCP